MFVPWNGWFQNILENKSGLLSVFGAFIIQLCAGAYHGTFGNLLPYFLSYLKQKNSEIMYGDIANIMSIGGLVQGLSFLLGGLILVPLLGPRRSLLLGCVLFTLAPLLTYACLVMGAQVEWLYVAYGMMSSASLAILTLVTMTLPTSWFPKHRGKVIGFIASGFGFSSTAFLVNPSNISPVSDNSSMSAYFMDHEVLENIPFTMLCMAAIYAILFTFAMLVTVGSPSPPGDKQKADQLTKRLYGAFSFLYNDAARDLNFYLLWLTRFLYLTVGAAVLAHWKTFSFTQSENDQLVSIVGSLSGVVNFISRLLAGVLLDMLGFRKLMSLCGILLTVNLVSIYFIGQNFFGLMLCVWLVYFLAFGHFSTIPAQAHVLFPGSFTYVVIGCVGLAESFAYGALAIINKVIMSHETHPHLYLIFFLTLAACSLSSIPVTWFVSDKAKSAEKKLSKELKI